jgi:hypothetical protein
MRGYILDTNESLEFELKLIHEYETYSQQLKDFESGSFPTTDPNYSKVELLNRCLPILLKQKEEKLSQDKLYNYIKKLDSKNVNSKKVINSKKGIKNKINMKNY